MNHFLHAQTIICYLPANNMFPSQIARRMWDIPKCPLRMPKRLQSWGAPILDGLQVCLV